MWSGRYFGTWYGVWYGKGLTATPDTVVGVRGLAIAQTRVAGAAINAVRAASNNPTGAGDKLTR